MRVKEAFPILLKIDAPQNLYQRKSFLAQKRHKIQRLKLAAKSQTTLDVHGLASGFNGLISRLLLEIGLMGGRFF